MVREPRCSFGKGSLGRGKGERRSATDITEAALSVSSFSCPVGSASGQATLERELC